MHAEGAHCLIANVGLLRIICDLLLCTLHLHLCDQFVSMHDCGQLLGAISVY